MAGYQVLSQILQWLGRSFGELLDDRMDGRGSSQDCRLAIQITACGRGLPNILEMMRIRLLQGRIRYANAVVTRAIAQGIYPFVAWEEFAPLENTPNKCFTEELLQQMRALGRRQMDYEDRATSSMNPDY